MTFFKFIRKANRPKRERSKVYVFGLKRPCSQTTQTHPGHLQVVPISNCLKLLENSELIKCFFTANNKGEYSIFLYEV